MQTEEAITQLSAAGGVKAESTEGVGDVTFGSTKRRMASRAPVEAKLSREKVAARRSRRGIRVCVVYG